MYDLGMSKDSEDDADFDLQDQGAGDVVDKFASIGQNYAGTGISPHNAPGNGIGGDFGLNKPKGVGVAGKPGVAFHSSGF